MRETDTHIYFWAGWMSNFHPCTVVLFNHHWPTSEHAYMAAKANYFEDFRSFANILSAPTPKEAKYIGRNVQNFDQSQWDEVSFDWMTKAVTSKFLDFHNPNLHDKLIATGTKMLVEASPFDKIWGVGLGENDDSILDEKNWTGKNWLGKVLMKVRSEV